MLARMSATEYIDARRAGNVTCEEYITALTKRMKYYQYMNQFMYWDIFPNQTDAILAQAKALDKIAIEQGVEAIKPLYGLPIPIKGTVATVDFPSSAGSGVLHQYFAREDADIVHVLRRANAVLMGKTNVPEFACSLLTANYANGRALNPYDHSLVTCGSSGGAASAVATYIAPIALSEDTGGSTRCPALHQNNFGYDPVRNHYPNAGNPGLTFTNDQLGFNARSLDDVLLVDAALLGTSDAHAAAAAAAKPATRTRVGTPRRPYLEVPGGPRATLGVEEHLLRVHGALQKASVALVACEWALEGGTPVEAVANSLERALYTAMGQMATWVHDALDADVSPKAVVSDMHTMGASHHPMQCFAKSTRSGVPGAFNASETLYRGFMAARPSALEAYNSIFTQNQLDLLLLPAMMSEAVSYVDAANATVPLRMAGMGNRTVGVPFDAVSTFALWKSVPVPKLLVPTGLDARGRPTGVMLFGRGPEPSHMFNDTYAQTFDLPFLYAAKAVVEALAKADHTLTRTHAPLVDDLFAQM